MSREDLMQFGVSEKRITLIAPGIDPIPAHHAANTNQTLSARKLEESSAVFIGRLISYKNVDTVIKAFKIVVRSLPNVKLVIVGDGTYKESLRKEAASIENNVIFTGRVTQEEKASALKNSAFMVFPSLHEGFGIVILEAFSCGRPVLVSDIRPPSDIVKNNYTGYVIPAFDVDEWAAKMIHLFQNTKKQQELGTNALREYYEKYGLENVINEFEKLYQAASSRFRDNNRN
jgi:glycosyltransferase involved in cell wall biosynthesis